MNITEFFCALVDCSKNIVFNSFTWKYIINTKNIHILIGIIEDFSMNTILQWIVVHVNAIKNDEYDSCRYVTGCMFAAN